MLPEFDDDYEESPSKQSMLMQRVGQTGYMRGYQPDDVTRVGLPDLEKGYQTRTTTEGKRLVWFVDAAGRKHMVDQAVSPSEPLEEEFGEAGGELQGAARLLKGLYNEPGVQDWWSLKELIDYISG